MKQTISTPELMVPSEYFGKRPRGRVDPYARERKLLRRIERCKSEEGKVRAIVWALRFDDVY